jgi:hypothetical protein
MTRHSIRWKKAPKRAKVESFDKWIVDRIPGRPKAAVGGYEPAVSIAHLSLHDRGALFSRQLLEVGNEKNGWCLSEPIEPFAPWNMFGAEHGHICDMQFWQSMGGSPFAVGQDPSGARWWLTPATETGCSAELWTLKQQAPVLVRLPLSFPKPLRAKGSANLKNRATAEAALAAFTAAGRSVSKIKMEEPSVAAYRGKGLRKWQRSAE